MTQWWCSALFFEHSFYFLLKNAEIRNIIKLGKQIKQAYLLFQICFNAFPKQKAPSVSKKMNDAEEEN
jgi:hypothetical protein